MSHYDILFSPAKFQEGDPLGQRGCLTIVTHGGTWQEPTVSVERRYTLARSLDELLEGKLVDLL